MGIKPIQIVNLTRTPGRLALVALRWSTPTHDQRRSTGRFAPVNGAGRPALVDQRTAYKFVPHKQSCKGKDEAIKIEKAKECDYIVNLDKVEKEVKTLQMKQHQMLHSHLPRGSFLNHPPTCYFCFQKGHLKVHCFKFHKHEKLRKCRNRKKPPRVKQIWVRKDLVNQVRPERKEKGKSTQLVWVVKKDQFPNLVKPPLVDDTPSTNT
ncbi:hypothetical protein LWI29_031236 [Acer saccharum]|uniref:Uncharacterized protein n=1 Tax=Acer saccharum TaxID=4024 RepID=A0AA39RZC6_ACESA|nr:hypothetical protein LWI29_031236 [Acer saccharum]